MILSITPGTMTGVGAQVSIQVSPTEPARTANDVDNVWNINGQKCC